MVDSAPPIHALKLSDGQDGATVRSLCRMVDIAPNRQIARIKRSSTLAPALLVVLVDTPGGPQQMDVLLDWAIPLWAHGLNISRLPERKRGAALVLQHDAVAAIRQALSKQAPAPEQDAPVRPAETPASSSDKIRQGLSLLMENLDVRQAISLLVEGFNMLEVERREEQAKTAELIRTLGALVERVRAIEAWLMSLDRRVAGTQGDAAKAAQQPGLSAAHRVDIRTLFRLMEQTTGRTQTQLEHELIETFRASAITAIPDELWPDVLAWCLWRVQRLP
jgi:hypothetical protein